MDDINIQYSIKCPRTDIYLPVNQGLGLWFRVEDCSGLTWERSLESIYAWTFISSVFPHVSRQNWQWWESNSSQVLPLKMRPVSAHKRTKQGRNCGPQTNLIAGQSFNSTNYSRTERRPGRDCQEAGSGPDPGRCPQCPSSSPPGSLVTQNGIQ